MTTLYEKGEAQRNERNKIETKQKRESKVQVGETSLLH